MFDFEELKNSKWVKKKPTPAYEGKKIVMRNEFWTRVGDIMRYLRLLARF